MVAKLPSASVLAAVIVSGLVACGGGSSPSTSEGAARLVTYHAEHGSEGLSFRYPASWSPYNYRCAPRSVIPIVYLSNERLRPPCTHHQLPHGSVTKGRAPVDQLGPGGVLVTWSVVGSLTWTLKEARGTPLEVDGFRAKLLSGKYLCGHIPGADLGLVLTVEPDVPHNFYELRACIAGPDSASTEAEVRALIRSAKLPAANGKSKHANSSAPGPIRPHTGAGTNAKHVYPRVLGAYHASGTELVHCPRMPLAGEVRALGIRCSAIPRDLYVAAFGVLQRIGPVRNGERLQRRQIRTQIARISGGWTCSVAPGPQPRRTDCWRGSQVVRFG